MTDTTIDTEEAKTKTPRARWGDAQIVRLSSNKPEDCSAVWLLRALVACNIAHGTVDDVISAPAGTVMKYLKSNSPVEYTGTAADGEPVALLMNDSQADVLIDKLAALKLAGAFTPRGLDLTAVLRVLVG